MANELNDSIKFTLELPNNNQLPFLDTMVSFDREIKQFSTALHIKPIHSLCITPWDPDIAMVLSLPNALFS